MEHDIPELLKKMMEAMEGGQVELARRLGGKISQPDVSRWLAGAEPKGKNYQRIIALAHELGALGDVRSEDVAAGMASTPIKRTVRVKGYVGASGEAFYYRLADEDFEEVEAPEGSSDQTVAVEIRGKSFGPLVDSWLVFYDDVRSPVTEDLIGKTCVIGLADDRIVLKEIQRNGRGGYRLLSNSGEGVIENAQIEWAAKVNNMRQR
jgi:hypothetical protein